MEDKRKQDYVEEKTINYHVNACMHVNEENKTKQIYISTVHRHTTIS